MFPQSQVTSRDSEEDNDDSEAGSSEEQDGSSFASFFNSLISGGPVFVSIN